MTKKHQGAIGQLRVAYEYQQKGYNVLLPFGDLQKYDLVVEKDGQFTRIQVKTVHEHEGYIYVDTRVVSHNLTGFKIKKYLPDDFDILAVVEMNTQVVYVIPHDGTQSQFTLRTKSAKNNQRNKVRIATDYLL